ncbi:MAG: hemerythrin domain-containing protein [Rubripirellula sp.]
MNTKQQTLPDLYQQWSVEDRQLEACVDEVRHWMQEVAQLGIPHFGETATRLRPLAERLGTHFQREDDMIQQVAQLYPNTSPEVNAIRRQATRDHDQLRDRLGDLIERLDLLEPPFESWQLAIDEVELFVDMLEQHEEQESESIRMLMPAEFRVGSSGDDSDD